MHDIPGRNVLAFATVLLAAALGAVSCKIENERLPGRSRARAAGFAIAASTSGNGTSAAFGTGRLARRAADWEAAMQARHLPDGLYRNARYDAAGKVKGHEGYGDAAIWTGCYAAAEALRFRVTGDPAALAALEDALWALHHLHAITGVPGLITRGFNRSSTDHGDVAGTGPYAGWKYRTSGLSRDQYTGWFFGVGLGWDLIQDPGLRDALREDVRAIARNLMTNDLAIVGGFPGQAPDEHFDLDPDDAFAGAIDAHTWNTVDDFPLNLLVQAVPYDPAIAAKVLAIKLPPVKGGEAMRALMMFGIAAKITGDPAIESYRRGVLLGSKDLPRATVRYTTLVDDALHGVNGPAVDDAFVGMVGVAVEFLDLYIDAKKPSWYVSWTWKASRSALKSQAKQGMLLIADFLRDPTPAKRANVLGVLALAGQGLRFVGMGNAARLIDDFRNKYGPHLSREGFRQLSDQMSSGVGLNLTLLGLAGLCHTETDKALLDAYAAVLDKVHGYVEGEQNAWADAIHAGWGRTRWGPAASEVHHALTIYPEDRRRVLIDNSAWPGLVLSPWVDRFGQSGNFAVQAFPLDHRERHQWIWQQHPREVKAGSNEPDVEVAPLGWLAAYWMARYHGLLGAAD